MADRVDLDTVRQFVAMLVQTERLGTPIARALGQFADGLRTKRLMLAEEQAAKTTVKLIFPLTHLHFPRAFCGAAWTGSAYDHEDVRRYWQIKIGEAGLWTVTDDSRCRRSSRCDFAGNHDRQAETYGFGKAHDARK